MPETLGKDRERERERERAKTLCWLKKLYWPFAGAALLTAQQPSKSPKAPEKQPDFHEMVVIILAIRSAPLIIGSSSGHWPAPSCNHGDLKRWAVSSAKPGSTLEK